MNPKVVGLVGISVQPEEPGVDLAFANCRKPQPSEPKKAEGGQRKHRKGRIENIHCNELPGRPAEMLQPREDKRICASTPAGHRRQSAVADVSAVTRSSFPR
jgi:hypothetical protein